MYLTVKEAIDISGKSQTTIHRLCQKNEDSKYIKKEGNKYLIDKSFLLEKYPSEKAENEAVITPAVGEDILKSLEEKNLQITELTISNKTLKQKLADNADKIKALEKELFDNQHELAEALDDNAALQKEMKANSYLLEKQANNEISETDEESTENTELDKKELIFKIGTITVSAMVLVLFIFMMYYLTK